jgi:hypothetical protein
MNKTIFINGKIFKQYKNTKYYCDDCGTIYSDYSQKILKPLLRGKGTKTYYCVDINFGKGQKHIPIHKIVYETWIGKISKDKFVLHKDDNQLNNNINNLYLGNQKENIQDCIRNNHRVGDTWVLTVYDKEKKETLTFCPAYNFIEYCGHPCANGGVKRMFNRNWFKVRFDIIDYRRCKNLFEKKGVTTIPDECREVG